MFYWPAAAVLCLILAAALIFRGVGTEPTCVIPVDPSYIKMIPAERTSFDATIARRC